MRSLVVLSVLAVAIGAAYTAFLIRRAPTEVWPWLHGLVATVLSVFLGLAAGFWVYEKQQAEAEERERKAVRSVLQREIFIIHEILTGKDKTTINVEGVTHLIVVSYLQPLAIERAVQSGLFTDDETASLLNLALTVRSYSLAVEFLFSALTASEKDKDHTYRLRYAAENIEKKRRGIAAEIERLSQALELPLTAVERREPAAG